MSHPHNYGLKVLKLGPTTVKMIFFWFKHSLFFVDCVEQGMVAKDVKMHRGKDEFGKAVIALSTEQSITFARTP